MTRGPSILALVGRAFGIQGEWLNGGTMTWWEIVLEVGLIALLIYLSYQAGRMDLLTKLTAKLDDWAKAARKAR